MAGISLLTTRNIHTAGGGLCTVLDFERQSFEPSRWNGCSGPTGRASGGTHSAGGDGGGSGTPGFAQLARFWLGGAPPSPQLLVLSPHSPAPVVGRERRVQLSRMRGARDCPGVALTFSKAQPLSLCSNLVKASLELKLSYFLVLCSTSFLSGWAVFPFPSKDVVPLSSSRNVSLVSKTALFCSLTLISYLWKTQIFSPTTRGDPLSSALF